MSKIDYRKGDPYSTSLLEDLAFMGVDRKAHMLGCLF